MIITDWKDNLRYQLFLGAPYAMPTNFLDETLTYGFRGWRGTTFGVSRWAGRQLGADRLQQHLMTNYRGYRPIGKAMNIISQVIGGGHGPQSQFMGWSGRRAVGQFMLNSRELETLGRSIGGKLVKERLQVAAIHDPRNWIVGIDQGDHGGVRSHRGEHRVQIDDVLGVQRDTDHRRAVGNGLVAHQHEGLPRRININIRHINKPPYSFVTI